MGSWVQGGWVRQWVEAAPCHAVGNPRLPLAGSWTGLHSLSAVQAAGRLASKGRGREWNEAGPEVVDGHLLGAAPPAWEGDKEGGWKFHQGERGPVKVTRRAKSDWTWSDWSAELLLLWALRALSCGLSWMCEMGEKWIVLRMIELKLSPTKQTQMGRLGTKKEQKILPRRQFFL